MHELSLAIEIVQMLEQHAHEVPQITCITLDIGALSCVEPNALRTALEQAMQGTLAQGAQIIMNHIPAQAACGACAQTFSPPTRIDPCPHCGSFQKKWLSGQDFKLKSIEGISSP